MKYSLLIAAALFSGCSRTPDLGTSPYIEQRFLESQMKLAYLRGWEDGLKIGQGIFSGQMDLWHAQSNTYYMRTNYFESLRGTQ